MNILPSRVLPSAACLLALTGALTAARPASAIIVAGGSGRHLAPPAGAYAGSGWQYEGTWGKFAGTAVGPHHFITAKHVGGFVGDRFVFGGKSYEAINCEHVPGADLTVWTVDGDLPRWAPLYEAGDEMSKPAALFGCGTARGEAVSVGGRLCGWKWGPGGDGRLSWGAGVVGGIFPFDVSGVVWNGGKSEMLAFAFRPPLGRDIGSASNGDSGGGVFIKDGGTWKLAGVIHASAGVYSQSATGGSFNAALFDARGLFRAGSDGRNLPVDGGQGDPAASVTLATRLAPHAGLVREVTQRPPCRAWLVRPRWLTRKRVAHWGRAGLVALVAGLCAAGVAPRLKALA